MKKLMIAAAIVCAAVVSQGASFSWTTSGKAWTINADDLASGLAYDSTYDAASSGTPQRLDKRSESYTYKMILSLLDGAGGSVVSSETLTGTVNSFSSGKIAMAMDSAYVSAGSYYDVVITLSGTITDGKSKSWAITSDELTSSSWFATTTGDISLETVAPTEWSTESAPPGPEPTPEPTSAMLMLLGMAGLALKRKRA